MKKALLLLVPLLLLSSCSHSSSCNHEYELKVTKESKWHTFIKDSDFNPDGLEVSLRCSKCGASEVVEYELSNNTALELEQESVTIKYQDYTIDYPIKVKEKYHIACVGDSLTAGHNWPNEAYPVYLQEYAGSKYQIENCGVNGISITGYGGSWNDPEKQYIKQDVYKKSVNFKPDIFAIMLGTNDATGWTNAKDKFYDQYCELLDSYIELFPDAKFIMMVSPPVVTPNQFNIPNDEIKNYVNPIQRELAGLYDFELLDLRKEFEATLDYQSKYLRPNNDNVHFTKEGAQFVASRVWEIAQNLYF